MKKSVILGVALGLAALTGIGWAGVATAQEGYRNDNREWREDDNRGYGDRDNGNRDYGNRGNGNRAGAFVGTWRLDERRNRQGWNDRQSWNDGLGLRSNFNQLPSLIRIERERRELRVENARGRLLREIDLRGGGARNGQFQVVSTVRGARVVETFTLRERGHELVIHTTVHARRGQTRQFTSIYDRA